MESYFLQLFSNYFSNQQIIYVWWENIRDKKVMCVLWVIDEVGFVPVWRRPGSYNGSGIGELKWRAPEPCVGPSRKIADYLSVRLFETPHLVSRRLSILLSPHPSIISSSLHHTTNIHPFIIIIIISPSSHFFTFSILN